MPDFLKPASLRRSLRAIARTAVLVVFACLSAACGQQSASQAGPAPDPTPAAAAPEAVATPTAVAPVVAPLPPAAPPAAAIAEPAAPPPRLSGIALADATAAAGPVSDRAIRPDAAPTPATNVARVDDRCNTAADCAVKDVGSCCGYRPQCVNRDARTDPEAAKASCASAGRVGICGFPAIASCECVQGRCAGVLSAVEGVVH